MDGECDERWNRQSLPGPSSLARRNSEAGKSFQCQKPWTNWRHRDRVDEKSCWSSELRWPWSESGDLSPCFIFGMSPEEVLYRPCFVELFLALTLAARYFLPASLMKRSKLSNYSSQEETERLKNGKDINIRSLHLFLLNIIPTDAVLFSTTQCSKRCSVIKCSYLVATVSLSKVTGKLSAISSFLSSTFRACLIMTLLTRWVY